METLQVHNRDDMLKTDVKGVEEYREYVLMDGSIYRITAPETLYIKRKASGDSHRVIDAAGLTHYIPNFRAIRWRGEVVA